MSLGQPFELATGVLAMFTSRQGGVSLPPYDTLNLGGGVGDDAGAVGSNRALLASACGLRGDRLAWMRQVHGSAAKYVAAGAAAAAPPEVDALCTDVPGLALGVLAADCAPVLIADARARVIGAAHAGREGMAAGVVAGLVAAMSGAGAAAARMHAMIGPLICGACYEVPERLLTRVVAVVPGAGCRTRTGSPGIDIRSGIEAQLAAAGVRTVMSDGRCTAETPGLYSYRRDGRTGRFAGLVWLAS